MRKISYIMIALIFIFSYMTFIGMAESKVNIDEQKIQIEKIINYLLSNENYDGLDMNHFYSEIWFIQKVIIWESLTIDPENNFEFKVFDLDNEGKLCWIGMYDSMIYDIISCVTDSIKK